MNQSHILQIKKKKQLFFDIKMLGKLFEIHVFPVSIRMKEQVEPYFNSKNVTEEIGRSHEKDLCIT